jgi:hypothetical protein
MPLGALTVEPGKTRFAAQYCGQFHPTGIYEYGYGKISEYAGLSRKRIQNRS